MTFYDSDPEKEELNHKKHGTEFRIAIHAVLDPKGRKFYDSAHSGYNSQGFWEDRWCKIGKAGRRILFVSYTIKNCEIRIISARIACKKQRLQYILDNEIDFQLNSRSFRYYLEIQRLYDGQSVHRWI